MKTNSTCTLLSGMVAVALLAGGGEAGAKKVQIPPTKGIQAKPLKAAQAEPTDSPAVAAPSAGAMRQFTARSGSRMRLQGGANMIKGYWRVESSLIGGYLNVGAGFPTEPGQAVTPGKVEVMAEVFIPVTTLKGVDEDGRHYSDAMDDLVHEKLKANSFKKIEYHLSELVLKESAWRKDIPYLFDAKGDLVIAGVTNALAMPVQVLPLGGEKLKITGAIAVKMTSFNITPPTGLGGQLKTLDEVKLSFEWMVALRGTPTRTAAK